VQADQSRSRGTVDRRPPGGHALSLRRHRLSRTKPDLPQRNYWVSQKTTSDAQQVFRLSADQQISGRRWSYLREGRDGDAVRNGRDCEDVASASVLEMKASWIREDKILGKDHENFLEHVRDRYGASSSSRERQKGVAQLARIIGSMVRGEWKREHGEYAQLKATYPVLLMHDERMGATGSGNFLD
jgi:hypothetical protein